MTLASLALSIIVGYIGYGIFLNNNLKEEMKMIALAPLALLIIVGFIGYGIGVSCQEPSYLFVMPARVAMENNLIVETKKKHIYTWVYGSRFSLIGSVNLKGTYYGRTIDMKVMVSEENGDFDIGLEDLVRFGIIPLNFPHPQRELE